MGFAETFKALSDPARREILLLLRKGRLSAGEIGSHFDMTGATISSRAVTRGVKSAVTAVSDYLAEGGAK